jgi:hypothetical protein
MKKTHLIFLLIIIIPFLLLPQLNPSHKINQPNSSSVWYTGERYTIVWDKVARKVGLVSISLLGKNQSKPTLIASNIKNKGEYRWKIPLSIKTGKYKIIITAENRKSHLESDIFQIRKGKGEGSLVVTNPKAGSGYPSCTPVRIKWQITKPLPFLAKTDISLYRGSNPKTASLVCIIAKNITLTPGYYDWVLSRNGCPPMTASGDHFIKVTHGKLSGNSGVFQILRGQTAWITVSQPDGSVAFHSGQSMQIQWNHYGIIDYEAVKVDILLQSMENLANTCSIAQNIPVNDKTYTWTISHATCSILHYGSDLKEFRVWIKVSKPSDSCIGDGYSSRFNYSEY